MGSGDSGLRVDLAKVQFNQSGALIVYGAAGLESAICGRVDGVPVQRCTGHKHRNLPVSCAAASA